MWNGVRARVGEFNSDLPLASAHTIPNTWYFDPDLAVLERESVFASTWQLAARADQLTVPGSFVTVDIAGEPLLVLRDGEGILRAFYNVCRHRAAKVACAESGHATKLRCRYHGWTYDLTGRLRGTPEFEGVQDFPREANGLTAVTVAQWGPFVFVHLNPPQQELQSFLAPIPERTPLSVLEPLRFVERRSYDLACNWKVFVDNYLDGGYHVNTVHPGLAGVLDYSEYRSEIFENTSVQTSPLTTDSAGISAVRSGDRAWYWWIHPNLMINLYGGIMDTNLVIPTGLETCRVIFDFYFADPDGPGRHEYIARSIAVGHQIQLEDQGICEEVQRGLHSRSFRTGRFSVRREATGYHFHQLLARQLQAAAH